MTVNAEDEVSFAISDAAGRSVMSGKLDNYKRTVNSLVTWSCQVHDLTSNLAGYGTLVESRSIDGLGYTTKQRSDGDGRILRSLDQLDNATSFTYDAGSNRLSVRDPNNVGADMVYDNLGRNTTRTDTFGDVTKTEYDRAGNTVKQIDAKNKNTLIAFDARGRRKSTTDRIGAVTTFAYTALGQLLSLTDAENQTTAYTYDSRGSKLTEQYPDHVANAVVGTSGYGVVTFVYDQAGRVLRKQDQAGDTCTYNYDLAGRMTSRNYRTATNSPSGTIADTDAFTLDRSDRILNAVSGRYLNTVGYAYDPSGRKGSESLTISGQTYTIGSEYNARNELVNSTYPDGSNVGRSYHPTGALNQLKLVGSTVSTRTYDNGRRLTSEVLGNGITETRTYRTDNLLSTITYSDTNIGNLTYSWDANKNKTAESISGVMSGYGFTAAGTTYDFEDRLTGYQRTATSGPAQLAQAWSLTSAGDLTSVTTNGTSQARTHGSTHELLSAGGQAVITDVKGNTTILPSILTSTSSPLSLSYDFDNEMRSADIDSNGSADVNFQYDALGRRVARIGSSGSLVYVQTEQQTIADYGIGDLPSAPLYRYVYASFIDEPVARKGVGASGTVHYFHRNQQYSIYAVTNSAGAIAERYAYAALGEPTILSPAAVVQPASAINNRYMYTSREWDASIGLHQFRSRLMSGQAGRFLSRDPMRYVASFSLYSATLGLDRVDPLGWLDMDVAALKRECGESSRKNITRIVPRAPEPGDRTRCQDYMYTLIEQLKMSGTANQKLILSQFNENSCKLPKIECKCCEVEGAKGFYVPRNHSIDICTDKNGSPIHRILEILIIHELTHALQHCNEDQPGGCEPSLRRELEAYYCSGDCTSFETCVPFAIRSSCLQSCTVNEMVRLLPQLEAWFDNKFQSGELCRFPRGRDYPAVNTQEIRR